MSKAISRHCYFRIIVKLLLQKMQTQLKILNYIVVVGTTLVMFDIATTQDLPIFCLEQLLHFLLFGV